MERGRDGRELRGEHPSEPRRPKEENLREEGDRYEVSVTAQVRSSGIERTQSRKIQGGKADKIWPLTLQEG